MFNLISFLTKKNKKCLIFILHSFFIKLLYYKFYFILLAYCGDEIFIYKYY